MANSTEWVGYLAMAFLVISFIPTKLNQVRILNLAGCIFFVLYGYLLGWRWPIIISNGLVAIIQVYHLIKSLNTKREKS